MTEVRGFSTLFAVVEWCWQVFSIPLLRRKITPNLYEFRTLNTSKRTRRSDIADYSIAVGRRRRRARLDGKQANVIGYTW